MAVADLSVATDDFDTLGGRLSRARDAKSLSLTQVAKLAGVDVRTLETWENDRAVPRSNRLAMLAGILGISPTWLLFGRGASPAQDCTHTDVDSIKLQLNQLKGQLQKVSTAVENVEESLMSAVSKTAA